MKQLFPALILATSAIGAQAGTFDGWTLNGSAQLLDGGNTLRLTDAGEYLAGSGWAPGRLSLDHDFSIAFSFRLAEGSGADGITLAIQNSDAGSAALGGNGGFLGYQNVNHSVAFVYDTFDNGWDTDRVGGANTSVAVDGNLVSPWGGSTVGQAHDLRGKVLYSWVDYSAAGSGSFTMYFSDTAVKPGQPDQSLLIPNAASLFNGRDVYVGFTGATGGSTDKQDILSVTITPVPEPSVGIMTMMGVLAMLGLRRRRAH
jgi:hypothetical protein